MAEGDGDGIGGIVRLGHLLQMQKPPGHILHLVLGGVAVAHNRLLHLHGLIGIYLQPRLADGQQDHATALGNANAGGHILPKKQLFDGNCIGLCLLQKLSHILIDDLQPGGKIHACRSGDGAAAAKGTIAPLGIHNAETGDPVAGIDPQYAHIITSFFIVAHLFYLHKHDFLFLGNATSEVRLLKQFHCPTEIVLGQGSAAALQRLHAQRLFLVSDPYFAQNGTAGELAALSGAPQWQIFSEISPDPTVELVARGTAQVKAFNPDVLVALGGGSAMDAAKAMLWFSGCGATLVAIPTTSGSGSEVTDFAIVTHGGVKHPVVDPALRPRMAILDSALLDGLPRSLIADGGFDVLSHALEAYVAADANPITDALAVDAFRTAYSLLPASFGGDKQVRLRIHAAATMAGMAFSGAGLGLCHALSHSLGGMFHLPHGRLNAILLPSVIRCNAHAAGERYIRLAELSGISVGARSMAVRNLCNGLIRLRRELELPGTLAAAGVDPARLRRSIPELTASVLADPCCKTNPTGVTDFLVHQVLEEVCGNG